VESEEVKEFVPLVYGKNYERLQKLKKKYDPKNLFCRTQAPIKPKE